MNNHASSQEVNEILSKKNVCYVLVACSSPSNDGEMKVEMTYEGDPVIASYLLESAQQNLEHQINSQ